jgi:hypothetical protein
MSQSRGPGGRTTKVRARPKWKGRKRTRKTRTHEKILLKDTSQKELMLRHHQATNDLSAQPPSCVKSGKGFQNETMGRCRRQDAGVRRRGREECSRLFRGKGRIIAVCSFAAVILATASLSVQFSCCAAAANVVAEIHKPVVPTGRTHRGGGGWSDQEDCVVFVTWEEEIPDGSTKGDNRMAVSKSHKAWSLPNLWKWNPFGMKGGDDNDGRPTSNPPPTQQDNDPTLESTDRLRNRLSASEATRARVLQDEPHPLRTDAWQLHLQWRTRRFVFGHPSTLILDFDPAGYVRCRRPVETVYYRKEGVSDTETGAASQPETRVYGSIGTWELTPTGLSWTIGLDDEIDEDDYDGDGAAVVPSKARAAPSFAHHPPIRKAGTGLYLFHADLHLHPFGPRPRLSRGVVLHEKGSSCGTSGGADRSSRWFRPVVATFSGFGVGRDTVDLSYRGRRRR